MAEGVFGHVAAEAGRGEYFHIESAGTGSWHVGNPPDRRAIAAAARRGIDLSGQRARRVQTQDFEKFDFILAMDASNQADLLDLASEVHAPKVQLFLHNLPNLENQDVPDPYYGGEEGFEEALNLIERGSRALLARLT